MIASNLSLGVLALECVEAPMPSGNFKTYALPKLEDKSPAMRGGANNKRQLQTKDIRLTPDTSMVYNAYAIYLGGYWVEFTLENKGLNGGTSNKQLVYELTVNTNKGPQSFRYFLFNTDSCKKQVKIPGSDFTKNAIADSKIYWINPTSS